MILEEMSNNWVFGGKIHYLKPLARDDGYFGATMMISGKSKRKDSLDVRKAKVICFLTQKDYQYLISNGAEQYDEIKVCGHFETWLDKRDNEKDMKICDQIISFSHKPNMLSA